MRRVKTLIKAIFFSYFVGAPLMAPSYEIETPNLIPRTPNDEKGDPDEITLLFVGDVMMGGRMVEVIRREGVEYPYKESKDILQSGDLAFCNLEAPFGRGGKPSQKKYTFLVPPEFGEGLLYAGFDGVSLANNHTMDYGMTGLLSTLALLDKKGIHYTGAGRNIEEARTPAIFEVKGVRIAFLSYSRTFPIRFYATPKRGGTAQGKEEYLMEDIEKAKRSADLVIVSFHWGGEKEKAPKYYMKELAHLAIQEGADCVVGHHPHVVQGIERYQNGIIAYSLGNFAFGSFSEKVSGIIFKIIITKEGWKRAEVIPIEVNNFKVNLQPKVMEGESARKELIRIAELSNPLGTKLRIEGDVGIIE